MAADPTLESTAAPIRRLEKAVERTAQQVGWLGRKAALWKWFFYGIGGLSASLTALAGVSILAEWLSKNVAGTIAVGSALLTSLIGFFDFDGRTVRVRLERAAWGRLHQQSLSLLSEVKRLSEDQLRDRVNELWDEIFTQQEADAEARSRK